MSYGKLACDEAGDTRLNTKYSKVYLKKAGDIRCESKYDSYDLGEVSSFVNNGKYDNIHIDRVGDVSIGARYTELRLDELANKIDLEMSYGGAFIDRIAKGFSSINLIGSYTNFKLGVADGCDYQMDAQASYAGIGYPSNLNVVYEKEKGSNHEVRGYVGSEQASSVIKARLNYGGLKVREN